MYSEKEVDTLVKNYLSSSRENDLIEILNYSDGHIIDGCFALHYYANLYYIYKRKPNSIDKLYGENRYIDIINKMKNCGESAYNDYYSNGLSIEQPADSTRP
jgi:hypothetical protein